MIAVTVRWFLTRHALQRMNEMGLNRARVCAALENPDVTYPDSVEHRNRTRHVAGDLVVVTERDVVITVLWHLENCADYIRPSSQGDVS